MSHHAREHKTMESAMKKMKKLKNGRMTRREFGTLAGALGVAGLCGSLGLGHAATPTPTPVPAPNPTKAPTQTTISITVNSDILTMDPHMSTLRESQMAYFCIFETLMTRDLATMKMKPGLATAWKATSPTTWEVDLKKGVKFHNGEDFKASTLKFNIERILNPDQKSPLRGQYIPIQKAEVLDDYKVRITTGKPWPVFEERMAMMWLLPEKFVKEKGDQFLVENAVGTGPYKYVKWTRGSDVTMERWEQYAGEKPAFKTAIVRIIPEITTAVAELLAGRVDIVRGVSLDQMEAVNKSGIARALTIPTLAVSWTHMDPQGRANPGNPFMDKRVRQAANYACNIDGYIKALQAGGERCPGGLNPLHFGFDKTIKPYPYDVAKAKQLLADAGWRAGADGVLVKDGKRFEVEFQTNQSRMSNRKQINEAIAQDLTKVGVKTKIVHIEDVPPYIAKLNNNRITPLFQWDWGSYNVFDADAIYWDMFHSGQGFCYYTTPELDKWLEDARSTVDPQKRLELYSKAQNHLNEEAPAIWMWAVHAVKGVSTNIDWTPCPDDLDRLILAKPKA